MSSGLEHEATAGLEIESVRAEIVVRAAGSLGVPPGHVREVNLELLLDLGVGIEQVAHRVVLRFGEVVPGDACLTPDRLPTEEVLNSRTVETEVPHVHPEPLLKRVPIG